MKTVNLSELPEIINSGEEIINFMLDNGYDTLVNDKTSGMEYSIDDVLESKEYLLIIKRLV